MSAPIDSAPALRREELRFEDIYEAHADYIWRVVQRLGVPQANLEDAVQDVFVVAYRKLGEFEGRSSVKTWLTGIAFRVVRDHRDKRKNEREELDEMSTASLEPTPLAVAERGNDLAVLDALLAQLDAGKREILVLADIEELSVPEISRILEINVNTAYSRLQVARSEFEQAVKRFRAKEKGGARR